MNTACVALAMSVACSMASASESDQGSVPTRIQLPASAPLSDVEIGWESRSSEGCANANGCSNYRITLHGDGRIELEELPWVPPRPKPGTRRRSIAPDEVITLVNSFFDAHFLEAPDHYRRLYVARRTGDLVTIYGRGGTTGGSVDLTLRIGSFRKTVRLEENVPTEIAAVKDQIWRIAGPATWAAGGGPDRPVAPVRSKAGVCSREASSVVGQVPQKIGGKIRAPKKIRDVRPKYPELPPGTTLGGVWVGEFVVDVTGKVARVWTIRPLQITPPFPPFNKSIVDAIQRWEYEPLRVNNEPRPFCVTMSININLQ